MLSGTTLGRYQVNKKIDAVGMGEVYLAKDERLDRKVALKVLLPEFCCDDERVQRFKLEAKAASALNHPSIITIHEIGEEDERLYIATEFVEGETLRALIENNDLSVGESIRIVEQIADALAVAHEAGIVHRDIKPENIMIRPDGYVKILDFGLAKPIFLTKPAGTEDLTVQMVRTQPGMVMGSVRYMSPEQARGKATDERTDVWSLGVVLYEMLTGTNPFEGETISDSLAALIYTEPPPLADVPEELQRILRKALRKNAAERYQSIKDLALDLKDLRAQMERDSAEIHISRATKTAAVARHSTDENETLIHRTAAKQNDTRGDEWTKTRLLSTQNENKARRFLPFGLIFAALVAVIGALYLLTDLMAARAPKFDAIQVSRLTETGSAFKAAISPDGKLVSFVNVQNGRQNLLVRQATNGNAVEVVPSGGEELMQPTFSPDGDYIFYVSRNKGIGALYRVAALGGERSKLIDDVDSNITFSPDGKKLAFFRHNPNEGGDTIFIADGDGGNSQAFVETKELGFDKFTGLDWSPDSEHILIGVAKNDTDSPKKVQIGVIAIKDKRFRTIGDKKWQNAHSFEWLKDDGIVFLGKPSISDTQQIWQMDFASGAASQITTDTSDYGSLSLAAESGSMIATKVDTISSFWSWQPKTNELKQLNGESKTLVAQIGISVASNGKLFYSRKSGEEINIYSMNEDGSGEKQLTSGGKMNYEPVVTPDGKYVVFSSNRNGFFNLWRIDAASGANPLRLTETQNAYDSQIDVAPDGKTVYFTRQSSDGGKTDLMRVSIDGGASTALFADSASSDLMPRIAPDGKRLAYQTFHYDKNTARFHSALKIVEFGENGSVKLGDEIEFGLHYPIEWASDGTAITYINRSGVDNVWNLSLKTKKESPLTNFNSGNITAFVWSGDGKKLFLARGIYNSDLILIKDASKL